MQKIDLTDFQVATSELARDVNRRIVLGEVTEAWSRVEPVIRDVIKRRCPALKAPAVAPTDPATQPRLRGAVVLFLQKHFSAPQIS